MPRSYQRETPYHLPESQREKTLQVIRAKAAEKKTEARDREKVRIESSLESYAQALGGGDTEQGIAELEQLLLQLKAKRQSSRSTPSQEPPLPSDLPPPSPEAEEPDEEASEETLLPSEEDYARFQTLHLVEPELVPMRTVSRADMFGVLQKIHYDVRHTKLQDLPQRVDFFNKLRRLYKHKEDPIESPDLAAYAEKLYRRFLRDHSLSGMVQNLFYLLYIHHDLAALLKIDLRRFQNIASALIDPLFVHHDLNVREFQEIRSIVEQSVSGDLGEELSRMVLKKVESYVQIRDAADRLKNRFAKNHEELVQLQPELKAMGDQLMSGIRNLRRYGLKSSYYQDGFLHEDDSAWVLVDIRDILHTERTGGIFALISLSQKDTLARAPITEFRKKQDGTSFRYESPYDAELSFFLKWDGELHDMSTQRHLSVREIFRRADAEAEYEMLRVSLLAHIHDLVVPVRFTRSLPSLDGLKRFIGTGSGDELGLAIQKILIPRIMQGSDSRIRRQLDSENRRSIREHDVTWSKRELPPGHHPSPEAIIEARKHDVILDPNGNETFVRPHKRGKGGGGVIHELREK